MTDERPEVDNDFVTALDISKRLGISEPAARNWIQRYQPTVVGTRMITAGKTRRVPAKVYRWSDIVELRAATITRPKFIPEPASKKSLEKLDAVLGMVERAETWPLDNAVESTRIGATGRK